MSLMRSFVIVLIIQLFFAFGITTFTYALPTESLDYVTSFSDLAGDINLQSVSSDVQDAVEDELDIPVIELGALVFYSGNILIDLILNFAFALPQMVTLLINSFLYIFGIDSQLAVILQLFTSAVIAVLYFIGILQLVMNIRGRGAII